jgi:hypothetical protein
MTMPGFPVRDKSGQKKTVSKASQKAKTASFRQKILRFFIVCQSVSVAS